MTEEAIVIAAPRTGLVVDRGMISWKQAQQLSVLELKLLKAYQRGDVDEVEAMMETTNRIVEKTIVKVPTDWHTADKPDDIKFGDVGWLDWARTDLIQKAVGAVRGDDEKKSTKTIR